MSASLLMWLFGGLGLLASSAYGYTWKSNRDLARDLAEATKELQAVKTELQTGLAKANETAQKAASAASDRGERLLNDFKSEVAKHYAEIEREMDKHTLEDARTYATQKALADVETRLFGAFTQLRTDIGQLGVKIDRVIERNSQVDRP